MGVEFFADAHSGGDGCVLFAPVTGTAQPGSSGTHRPAVEGAGRSGTAVVEVMAEIGIDIAAGQPRLLSYTDVKAADVVITMGCGDACPYYPGKRYEDWDLEDPAGKGVDAVRPIRDEIQRRVEILLEELVRQNA
jgi:protein-tyrosine-phosphatase